MAEATGPVQQAFFAQAAGIPPEQYQKLLEAQQQQALASALLQQGETPISTEGRSINGVGYAISPLEGVAKLAQVLSGRDALQSSNEALANALYPQGSSSQTGMLSGTDPVIANMPGETQMLFKRLMLPESAGGNPRAGIELYNNYAAGLKAYGTGIGTAAAGQAPAGTLPPGIATQGATNMPIAPQVNASQLQPNASISQGGQIPSPPTAIALPQGQSMPQPMPGESNLQYQARLEAAKAGAEAKAKEQGQNQAESDLNLAQINSRIANAKKNITEMLAVADKTSTAVPLIPEDLQHKYLQRFDPETAKANTRFEQLNNQIYVQELGPLIKQLGSRGNQFVENAVKQGSAVDIGDNPEAKKAALMGLYEYLDNIQQNAANQSNLLSGGQVSSPSAPQTGNGWSIRKVQ